ncbi:hypothetical protein P7K49_029446 [Saguinus oedipus]|uniref:Uncharacterized protein n=1 Tax=Saguinus oedipus TaxID=9490 RepID=A0ABQ9U985_SAGOE|nr:hypothetical protein P7K49_029446 [Saguinus oedipus]
MIGPSPCPSGADSAADAPARSGRSSRSPLSSRLLAGARFGLWRAQGEWAVARAQLRLAAGLPRLRGRWFPCSSCVEFEDPSWWKVSVFSQKRSPSDRGFSAQRSADRDHLWGAPSPRPGWLRWQED